MRDGALVVETKGPRPAILCTPCDIAGTRTPKVRVRLSATAGDRVTLSWTAVGLPRFSEPTSITLPLQADGKPHDDVFAVGENPRWRGKRITALRLEVGAAAGKPAGVRVELIRGGQ